MLVVPIGSSGCCAEEEPSMQQSHVAQIRPFTQHDFGLPYFLKRLNHTNIPIHAIIYLYMQ